MATPTSDTQRLAHELSRLARARKPGEDFGTVRGIAREHGVSIDVARRALALLVRHGLIRTEARKHVIADPDATIDTADDVAALKDRIAELERQVTELQARVDALESSADPELRARLGRIEAELADFKAVGGSPRQSGAGRRRASG
jgi:DNA-binding transcriptional regulator YhcF (GntR family)